MSRPLALAIFSCVLSAAALCAFPLSASGQISPEVESLAVRTADRVAKAHREHVLVAGLQECLWALDVCSAFEGSLDAHLEKLIPGVHLVKRESIVNILEGRGFLALDAYLPDVLIAVAPSAGADLLVTEDLRWQPDGYELNSEVYDVGQGKKLDLFRSKIARAGSGSGDEPLVVTAPESDVSMIVSGGKRPHGSAIQFPACQKCPDPPYTPEARANGIQGRVLLMATITEKGTAEQIGVVDGLDYGLTDQAMQAVQNWQFKPAIGKDGKPFAVRMPVEVTFRLH